MATPEPADSVPAVRLQSSDGKIYAVPLDVVRVSRTIDTMLKGAQSSYVAVCSSTVWSRARH